MTWKLALFTLFASMAFGQSSGALAVNPIARGGTGATSAAPARTNPGVATGYPVVATTVGALRATSVSGLPDGTVIYVLGYAAAGDDGGGMFRYDATSSVPDDGGTVLGPNAGIGRWFRQCSGSLDAKWFGAKGDGSTDDTNALRSALLASVGKELVLSPGTYIISDTLSPVSSTVVRGVGTSSIVKLKSTFPLAHDVISSTGVSSVALRDFVVDCTVATGTSAINLSSVTDVLVQGMTILSPSHAGIAINDASTRCQIVNNTIRNQSGGTGAAIWLFHGPNFCLVRGNTIAEHAGYGIIIDDSTSGQASAPSNDNVVTDNVIYSAHAGGGWGIGVEGSQRNVVSGNEVTSTGTYGIDVAVGNGATPAPPKDNLIVNNSINAGGNGIRVQGENNSIKGNRIIAAAVGVSVQNSGANTNRIYLNTIEGNTIGPVSGGANQTGVMISDSNATSNAISSNLIFGCAAYGIYINGGGNGTEIANNTIRNSAKHGILLDRSSRDIYIHHNSIWNSSFGSGPGHYYGIFLNAAGLTFTRLRIADNFFGDDQGAPTQVNGVVALGAGATYTDCLLGNNVSTNPGVQLTYYASATGIANNAQVMNLPIAAGSIQPLPSFAEDFTCTLTGNIAVADVNGTPRAGQRMTIVFRQDAKGRRSVTWGASYKTAWSDAGNAANRRSSITLMWDGSYWVQQGAQSPYF